MEQFHTDRFRLYSLFLLSFLFLVFSIFIYSDVGTIYAADGCGGQQLKPSLSQDNALEFIHLLNLERQRQQLPPYKTSDTLFMSSRYHVVDMREDGYFDKRTNDVINGVLTPLDDCSSPRRIRSFYDPDSKPDLTTTVIGVDDFNDGGDLLWLWLSVNSTSAALLSPNYREIGVGVEPSASGIAISAVGDIAVSVDRFPLVIENEAITVDTRSVKLYVYGEWDEIRLRNEGGEWSEWIPFTNDLMWDLSAGNGEKVVSAEMRSNDPNAEYPSASAIPDSIMYDGSSTSSTVTPNVPATATATSTPTNTPVPTAISSEPTPTSTPTSTSPPEGEGTLLFAWRTSSMPVEEGETFSVEIELTGENVSIAAPDVTILIPDGLIIEGYSANNEGLSTYIEDQRAVWYPIIGEGLGIYAYPAILTLQLRVVSVDDGNGGFVDEFTIMANTDRGEQSAFSVSVTSPRIPTVVPPTPTPLPTATNTPLPTATNTPLPTATNTPLPTATNTPLPTATNTPLPTATNTPLPTATNTPLATATTMPESPTETLTPLPSSPTPTKSETDTPLPTETPTPTITPFPVNDVIQMELEASSTTIASGETIDVNLTVRGDEITAPTIIFNLPAGLSLAGYDTNNEALPTTQSDSQTLVWYPVIAQVASNYEYPAIIDVSVKKDGARSALKVAVPNDEFMIEASAYVDGELLTVARLTVRSVEEEITPTPTLTLVPTDTPQPTPTDTPTLVPTSIPATDIPPTEAAEPVVTSTPEVIEAMNTSKGLDFVWQRTSTPIQQGDSFDVTLTLTGSQLAAPNTSIVLPGGLSLDGYESNNEFLATDIYGSTIVWHPVIGQQFVNYGTPATFTLHLTADSDTPSGEYPIKLSTFEGANSSFTIPVGSQDRSLEEPPVFEPVPQLSVYSVPETVDPGETFTISFTVTSSDVAIPEIVIAPRTGLEIDFVIPNNLTEPLIRTTDGSLTWQPLIDSNQVAYAYPATIDLTLKVSQQITQPTALVVTEDNATVTVIPINVSGIDNPLTVVLHNVDIGILSSLIYGIVGLSLVALTITLYRRKRAH